MSDAPITASSSAAPEPMTTPEMHTRALKLIFIARDRLVWDFNGKDPDIAV